MFALEKSEVVENHPNLISKLSFIGSIMNTDIFSHLDVFMFFHCKSHLNIFMFFTLNTLPGLSRRNSIETVYVIPLKKCHVVGLIGCYPTSPHKSRWIFMCKGNLFWEENRLLELSANREVN